MNGRLIADAFQTSYTVINGAELAVGFLAVLTSGALITVALLLYALVSRYQRTDREQEAKAQKSLEECTPPVQVTAALDLEAGRDLGLQDECELIYGMTARDPGPERLWWAIRDQQQRGD